MKPALPLLSPAFKYGDDNNAASHSDPAKFAARMKLRIARAAREAEAAASNVKQIKAKVKS
jgi:hypothetical protein